MCTECSKIGKRVQQQILLFQKTIKIAFESNSWKNFRNRFYLGGFLSSMMYTTQEYMIVYYTCISIFSTVFCMYGKESLTKGKKEIEILFCHRRYRKRVKNGKLFDSSQIKYCHRVLSESACDHVFVGRKMYVVVCMII